MARSFSSGKLIAWRRRVRRFGRSGVTVVRFCAEEGVSTASFYRWRKRLADRRSRTGDADQSTTHRADARRTGATEAARQTAVFQAVRVTPAETPMAIYLPGEVRIEVPAKNLDAVRAVLGELLRRDVGPQRGESSC